MELQYAIALIIAALISTIVAFIAWRRRSGVGGKGLFIIMMAAMVWSLTYAIRWLVSDPNTQLFWLDATYFGVVVAPTAFLYLALEFTNREDLLRTRNLFYLSIVPVLTIIILWTDPWHALFYNGMRTGAAILKGGIWFWVFIIYTYLILLISSILIFQKIKFGRPVFQQQAGILLIGMILPWISNIVSLFGYSPFPGLDLTPFVFTLSGLFFMVGLFRFHLLDLVPIAHTQLVEQMNDGVIVLDKEERIVDINPAAQIIFGLSSSTIGKTIRDATDEIPELADLYAVRIGEKKEIQIMKEHPRDYEVQVLPLLNKQKSQDGQLFTIHDVTEYKQAQEKFQRSEEQYRLLFENAVESILVVQNRMIVFCNPITTELTGYPMKEIINESFVKFIYPEDMEIVMENYKKRISGIELKDRYQFRLVRKDLSLRWVETSGIRIEWEGELATLHFLMDVTDRKKAEVALEFRSTHDILTGLFNRQYFEQEIEKLQTSKRFPVSILVMDMNGLKEINDTQGHAAGDEQLRLTAQVIRKAFRPDDIIARIGGDEFVVLLPESDAHIASQAVERVKKVLDDFNRLNPDKNLVSFAIGFSTSEETPNLRDVFRIADREMYIHKANYYADK
jgi:diguanylate cyclase (GGDEF)-like protein/PAS domain S-box-containing protein